MKGVVHFMAKRLLPVLIMLSSFSPLSVAAQDDFPGNSDMSSTRVDTSLNAVPYPILTPLKQGPLKTLFIGRYDRIAPVSLEIAARLDCTIETVLTPSRSQLADTERLSRLLDYNWDVVWLDFDIRSLPEKVLTPILSHVSLGGGLVYVGDMDDLDRYDTRGRVDENPLELISYDTKRQIDAVRREKGIMVSVPQVDSSADRRTRGDYLNGAAFSVFYAGGIQTETSITEIQMPQKEIEHEVMGIMKYRVHLERGNEPDTLRIISRIRSNHGMVLHESVDTFVVQSGNSFVLLDFVQLPVGTYSLDISVADKDGIQNFAGTSFQVGIADKLADVSLRKSSARDGNFVLGTINTTATIKEGLYVNTELTNGRGVMLERFNIDLVAGRMTADFSFKVKQPNSPVLFVRPHYYKNNELVQTLETPLFIERPYNPYSFSFIVRDRSRDNFMRSEKYANLVREGVTTIAFDMNRSDTPETLFKRAIQIARSGSSVIPVIKSAFIENNSGWEKLLTSATESLEPAQPLVYAIVQENGSPTGSIYERAAELIVANDGNARIGIAGIHSGTSSFPGGSEAGAHAPGMVLRNLTGDMLGTNEGIGEFQNTAVFDSSMTGFMVSGETLGGDATVFGYIPWYMLLNGMNTLWWDAMYGLDGAALTPQISVDRFFAFTAAAVREITDGIDELILKSERLAEGLPVLTGENGAPVSDVDVSLFRDGDTEYIGLIQKPYGHPARNAETAPVTVTFSEKGMTKFVYDIRSGTFLGAKKNIPVEIKFGDVYMFALLPYRVQLLNLSLENTIVQPGGNLDFAVSILPHDPDAVTGRHVFKIRVIDSGGIENRYYSRTAETENGVCTVSMNVLADDNAGQKFLEITDVISGKTVKKGFIVSK